jgi:hypothetical protein
MASACVNRALLPALKQRVPLRIFRFRNDLEENPSLLPDGSADRSCGPGTRTTTDRHFRHQKPSILWFAREFPLTTFPQPTILRTQTRGISEPAVIFLDWRPVH